MPQNGQQSYFVEYTATCGNPNKNFRYTRDTLVLHVIERNDSIFFTERFTTHSPSYITSGFTNTIEYPVVSIQNSLVIKARTESRLFYFYGSDYLKLVPDHAYPMQQENCRIMLDNSLFTGDEIGNINRFSIGNKSFKNKTVVSCIPVIYQLEGYLIYDKNEFLISHIVIDNDVRGWLKL
ncbi:MAG TPA: hypothetical protein PLJ60_09095 [Chryseolinea sp.]|nr:hypothetical protein [Chryseolinea sp.]